MMRSAPYGLLVRVPSSAATWGASHARMTHGAPIGQASSAAVAAIVSALVNGYSPTSAVREGEEAAARFDLVTAGMIREARVLTSGDALFGRTQEEVDVDVLTRWHGWAGHEAIAASAYCFLRHQDSYKDAVLLAVNSPGDSDSLGSITGAMFGAYAGISAIPSEWVERIEKRDQLFDLAKRFAAMPRV